MKLGGWHRLWLVFSIVWIAGAAFVYWSSHQSTNELYHDWASELIAYLVENSSEARGHTETSLRAAYSDISDRQLVELLHEQYLPRNPAYSYGFAKIDAKYRPLLQSLDRDFISHGQLWWLAIALGVPALIYIAGFAIAWVREGFRRK